MVPTLPLVKKKKTIRFAPYPRLMTLMQHLPNMLTLGNLVCGCLGIIYAFQYPPYAPAYFIWGASVFDFFDGFVARSMNTSASFGKQLDSLADLISFGVLPAMTMYTWMSAIAPNHWIAYSSIAIAAFSALRLAKFNLDENQKDSFVGLPTPANALLITGLVFFNPSSNPFFFNIYFLLAFTVFCSLILIAPIRLFALKFKNFTWVDNKLRFTFIALSVLLLGIKQAESISFIVLLYIILSLAGGGFVKKKAII